MVQPTTYTGPDPAGVYGSAKPQDPLELIKQREQSLVQQLREQESTAATQAAEREQWEREFLKTHKQQRVRQGQFLADNMGPNELRDRARQALVEGKVVRPDGIEEEASPLDKWEMAQAFVAQKRRELDPASAVIETVFDMPLFRTPVQTVTGLMAGESGKRLREGKATPEDYLNLAWFQSRLDDEEAKTFGRKVYDSVWVLPEYMGAIAGASPVAMPAKAAAGAAAKRAVLHAARVPAGAGWGSTGARAIGGGAKLTAGATAGALATMPLLQGMAAANLGQSRGAQAVPMTAMDDEYREIFSALPMEPMITSLLKAQGETYGDVWAEFVGGEVIAAGLKRLGAAGISRLPAQTQTRLRALHTNLLGEARELRRNVPMADFMKQAADSAQWHGMLAEMGEERIADVLSGTLSMGADLVTGQPVQASPEQFGITGQVAAAPFRDHTDWEGIGEDFAVEAATLTAPGTARSAALAGPMIAQNRQRAKLIDRWRKGGSATQAVTGIQDDAPERMSELKSPPGAHRWAEIVLGDRKRYKEAPAEATRQKQWQDTQDWKLAQLRAHMGLAPLDAGIAETQAINQLYRSLEQQDATQVPTDQGTKDVRQKFFQERILDLKELLAMEEAGSDYFNKGAAEAGLTGTRSEIREQAKAELKLLEKEQQDATQVPTDQGVDEATGPIGQGGQVQSSSDLRVPGQDQGVAVEPGEVTPASEVQVEPEATPVETQVEDEFVDADESEVVAPTTADIMGVLDEDAAPPTPVAPAAPVTPADQQPTLQPSEPAKVRPEATQEPEQPTKAPEQQKWLDEHPPRQYRGDELVVEKGRAPAGDVLEEALSQRRYKTRGRKLGQAVAIGNKVRDPAVPIAERQKLAEQVVAERELELRDLATQREGWEGGKSLWDKLYGREVEPAKKRGRKDQVKPTYEEHQGTRDALDLIKGEVAAKDKQVQIGKWREQFTDRAEQIASRDIAGSDYQKLGELTDAGRLSVQRAHEMIDNAVEAGVLDAKVGEYMKQRVTPSQPKWQQAVSTVLADDPVHFGDLFAKAKETAPDLTEDEFRRGVIQLANAGQIRLQPYTQAPMDARNPELAIAVSGENMLFASKGQMPAQIDEKWAEVDPWDTDQYHDQRTLETAKKRVEKPVRTDPAKRLGRKDEAKPAEPQSAAAEAQPDFDKMKVGDIYETTLKGQAYFAVHEGGKRGGGDTLWKTREDAEAEANRVKKRAEGDKAREERLAEQDKKEAAAKSEREDIDGFKADADAKALGQAVKKLNEGPITYDGKQYPTLKALIRKLVEDGKKPRTKEEPKVKPMSRLKYHRATQKEQDAHEKRMREAGTKTEYLVGDAKVGKIAHDYAEYLIGRQAEQATPAETVKEPWEMTREEYEKQRDDPQKKLPRDAFYINKVEILQNPSDSDVRDLSKEFRERFPESKDPSTRFTEDAYGNRFVWASDKATHSQVESEIAAKIGRKVSQNEDFEFSSAAHKRHVYEAIQSGKIESHPDYPDLQAKPEPVSAPDTTKAEGVRPAIPEPTSVIDAQKAGITFREADVPIDEVKLSSDVPNFKENADPETGEVEPLSGQYERLGTGRIIVWERSNGDLEVITGRHRLALAKRNEESTIPAQIVKEDDGFTKEMAIAFDAEANIRDKQGTVKDYANYFRFSDITEQEASSRGLLASNKGREGFNIGRYASDDVYDAFRGGKINTAQASIIAEKGQGDPGLQALGLKHAASRMGAEEIGHTLDAHKLFPKSTGKGKQKNLFGWDDSAIEESEKMGKAAKQIINKLKDQILAVQGAMRRPDKAKEMGLEGDFESIKEKLQGLRDELEQWRHWTTDRDLVRQVREDAGLPTEIQGQVLPPPTGQRTIDGDIEPLPPPKAKPIKSTGTGKQQPLFGKSGQPGQRNLFADKGVPDDLVAKPTPEPKVSREQRIQEIMQLANLTRDFSPEKAREIAETAILLYDTVGVPLEWHEFAKPGQLPPEESLKQQPRAPRWYTKARNLIQQKMGPKATPQQVLAMLQKNGVKAEELQWSGLEELLGGAQSLKSISKEDVLAAIDRGLRIEEVIRDETPERRAKQERLNELAALGSDRTSAENLEYERLSTQLTRGQVYGGEPKFASYVLPGGENYRELLLTIPTASDSRTPLQVAREMFGEVESIYDLDKEQQNQLQAVIDKQVKQGESQYRSSHWDEPNVVAHLRMTERIDADGKRVLFLEEVQSDWHQIGRKKGYAGQLPEGARVRALEPGSQYYDNGWRYIVEDGDGVPYRDGVGRTEQEALRNAHVLGAVPDAPFKKTWPMLAMKRAIQYAAENGFDRVAWTTGEQQIARYDLSKQVESIRFTSALPTSPAHDSGIRKTVIITLRNQESRPVVLSVNGEGTVVDVNESHGDLKNKPLEDVLGKELASRIMSEEGGDISGEGLKVGGQGMRAFYDKMLPNEVNKFIKKFGAQVGETQIPNQQSLRPIQNGDLWYVYDPLTEDTVSGDAMGVSDSARSLEFGSREEAMAFIRSRGKIGGGTQQHSFDVTPQMRESALTQGQPLYQQQQRGLDETVKGWTAFINAAKAIIGGTDKADFSTFIHEFAHPMRRFLFDRSIPAEQRADITDQDIQWIEDFCFDPKNWRDALPGEKRTNQWDRNAEEAFAQAWEQYWMEGKAPNAELEGLFQKIARWMAEVYGELKELIGLTPEVRKVFDKLVQRGQISEGMAPAARTPPSPIPEPGTPATGSTRQRRSETGEHQRAAAGSATMRVGDVDVEPSTITPQMAASQEGRQLIKSLTTDAAKSKKWSVGRRSIFEFLAKALHSRLIVARSQTSRSRPGVYRESPHVWFARSGLDAPTNLHEAGHALMGYLKDAGRLPSDFIADLTAFADINQPPYGFASAVNAHEGMAELFRIWITDPSSIPSALRTQFESVVESQIPGTLDALKDARLAFLYNESRPPAQKFIANINDHRKRNERTPVNQVSALWHALAQEVVGPSAAWTWLEKEIWRNMIGPQKLGTRFGRWFTTEGRKARRAANAVVRDVMRSLEDTPADVKTAQQLTFHVPSIVSNALYGTQEGVKGLRVHQFGNGFHDLPDADVAIEQLRAAGFQVPDTEGHGNWFDLHGKSLEDTRAALGNSWESFLAWGQYKTVLHRHRYAMAHGEGYRYPMMDTMPPDVLETIINDMARANPSWNGHYKALQALQDQALLLDVLSGEHTVEEVIRMKEAHQDYWTLPRQMENVAMQQGGGSGIHPTSGVRRQHGSQLPFVFEADGIERKLYRHISAYYDIAAKRAMLRLQQQMRKHPNWKQLPFAGRKFVESIMVPLKMDTTVAATLSEAELRQMAADAINGYLEQEAGEALPDEMRIQPDDVTLDEHNKPIFRHTAPRMANVISMFDPKNPGVRQYFYIPDRTIFMLQAQKGTQLLDWALGYLTIGREVTAPLKRELVQNITFSVRNIARDISTGVILAEDGKSIVPGVTHAIGLIEDMVGTDASERMAAELISRSLEGVHHQQHKGVWGSFVGAMSEGVVIPGYADMAMPQRIARIPGQSMSVVMKPITFINWLTFGRYLSSKSEIAGRAGAYRIARDRGLTPAAAQARFDRATGNFTQHTRNRAFAEMWRMMGFVNPAWQISWQMYDQAFHPDIKVRQQFYAVKLPIVAALGAAIAAATYLSAMALIAATSDDDEERKRRMEKWKQNQRNRSDWSRARYMQVGPLQLPFEYGPVGAIQSAAYVATMDTFLDGHDDTKRLVDIAAARMPSLTETIGGFLPVPMQAKAGIELALNYRFFFDDQVVAQRLKDMYPDSPHLQTWPDTPELYKTAGRALGFSPEQIRHATRGLLTSLGDDLVSAASRGFGAEASDWPMIGRLISREARGFSSQPVQDLREMVSEYDALLAEIKDRKRRGVEMKGLEERVKQLKLADVMNSVIEDAWEDAKSADTPQEANVHERRMTDLAARFFEVVNGKTTDEDLLLRLHVAIWSAYSVIGTPEKQGNESAESFAVREKEAATKKERLFVALQATGVSHFKAQELLADYYHIRFGYPTKSYVKRRNELSALYETTPDTWIDSPLFETWLETRQPVWAKWSEEAKDKDDEE